ncbi:MAG: NF038130 family PEP-CTERM protein [Cyanobacteria bacterium]|nr:NF038130 family PEP-CTERM protein [Cyanobacteriota bacterium]MDA0867604.1 NF038130 family PEP-CTERM protein [Cyanobacteriota bacterium]
MKFANLAIGASLLAGMMTAPAMAATYSTSGDTTVFDSDGSKTFLAGPGYDLADILDGNAGAPGGNVELNNGAASADLFAPANTLTGNLDSGRVVTFSSLTNDDWFGSGNLAATWFADALDTYGATIRARAAAVFGMPVPDAAIFNAFNIAGGFARLSDPNIAYVGEVTFGLAAHSDAGNVNSLLAGLFASEVVKVTLNGVTNYYYSFAAPTASGQTSLDGTKSHEGNYEFFIEDPQENESVPEPATLLGLMAVGGVFAASKRKAIA